MGPEPISEPHASCYHKPTSLGDSFGGLGNSGEVCEDAEALQPSNLPEWQNRIVVEQIC
jgi:hypothetical protein